MKKCYFSVILLLVSIFSCFFAIPNNIHAVESFPETITVVDVRKYQDPNNPQSSLAPGSGNITWNYGDGMLQLPLIGSTLQGQTSPCSADYCLYLNGKSAITYKVDGTNDEDTAVFCTMFGDPAPHGKTCTPTSWSDSEIKNRAIAAGVGQIIAEASNGKQFFAYFEDNNRIISFSSNQASSTLDKYYYAELSINRFLYDIDGNEKHLRSSGSNIIPDESSQIENDLVFNAKKKYSQLSARPLFLIYNELSEGELGLTYDEGTRIWLSNEERMVFDRSSLEAVDFFAYGLNGTYDVLDNFITVEITDSNGKEYNDYAYVVPLPETDKLKGFQLAICDNNTISSCKKLGENFTRLPNGEYKVKVTVDAGRTYYEAKNYDCGADVQTITSSVLVERDTNEKVTLTGTFTVNNEEEKEENNKGSIKLIKRDAETKEPLKGASFRIKQKNGSYDKTVVIDDKSGLTISDLELGTYEITEKIAPNGYAVNSETYTVQISKNGETKELIIDNIKMPQKGKILIKKINSETKKEINGASFAIYDSKNKKIQELTISKASGEYSIDLDLGTYYVKEIQAPAGYKLKEEKKTVKIETNGSVKTVVFENEPLKNGTIIIKKVDKTTNKTIVGATVRVKQVDGKFDKEYKITEPNGVIVENLELGEYQITEVSAPEGYELTDAKYTIVITNNNLVNEVIIKNEHKLAKVTITKIDEDSKGLKGAKLRVVNADTKAIIHEWNTNSANPITIELEETGNYYVEEIEAPEGYSLNKNKLTFKITDEYKDLDLKFKNEKIVKVPDTLSNISICIIVIGIISAVVGTWLILRNRKEKMSL